MKIKDVAQTIILICCLMIIPIFAFAYFLYSKTALDISAVFEKSFSAASGFFGGFATLTAAYIASRLFNDWRHQHDKAVEKDMAWVVIQKFDLADTHLAQFKDSFYFFKFKFNYLHEMPDDEFENLNSDLQEIIFELKGVVLEFGKYLESLRKYSIVAENTYFDDHKSRVSEIQLKILALQNLKITLPTSINDIDSRLSEIIDLVVEIEKSNLDTLLTELKTHT